MRAHTDLGEAMRRLILGIALFSVVAAPVSGHDYLGIPDIGALDEAETNKRCVALQFFIAEGLQSETVSFDFNYPSGIGDEHGQSAIQNFSDAFRFHVKRVADSLEEPDGSVQGSGLDRVLRLVGSVTLLYRDAISDFHRSDAEGRLPMKQTADARYLMSHDLARCVAAFLFDQLQN